MKCAVIKKLGKEIENIVIEKRDDLVAIGEYVRVKVLSTAINRADLLQRRGLYPAPKDAPQDVPGLEFAGIIDQVGEKVTDWKGGERVFGIVGGGSYAEQVLTHQKMAVRVQDRFSDIEAAAIPEVFITAHDALITQGGLKPGEIVLIHAVAGGVGSAAVQLVNLYKAQTIGTAGSKEKLFKIAGITNFIPVNYKEANFQDFIEKGFGKNSIDLVIDTIGASYWKQNVALLKNCGRLVLVGLLGGTVADTDLSIILNKRLKIIGTVLRSRPLEEKISATQAFSREVLPHFMDGKLKPVIDYVFPFEKLHEATARMEKNENIGKIIIKFS